MTHSQRLTKVVEWSKMTVNEFGKSLGFKRSMNLYYIINENRPISVKLAATICNKYPIINYEWLVKDSGEMIGNSGMMQKTAT